MHEQPTESSGVAHEGCRDEEDSACDVESINDSASCSASAIYCGASPAPSAVHPNSPASQRLASLASSPLLRRSPAPPRRLSPVNSRTAPSITGKPPRPPAFSFGVGEGSDNSLGSDRTEDVLSRSASEQTRNQVAVPSEQLDRFVREFRRCRKNRDWYSIKPPTANRRSPAVNGAGVDSARSALEQCRLFHQFDKKYTEFCRFREAVQMGSSPLSSVLWEARQRGLGKLADEGAELWQHLGGVLANVVVVAAAEADIMQKTPSKTSCSGEDQAWMLSRLSKQSSRSRSEDNLRATPESAGSRPLVYDKVVVSATHATEIDGSSATPQLGPRGALTQVTEIDGSSATPQIGLRGRSLATSTSSRFAVGTQSAPPVPTLERKLPFASTSSRFVVGAHSAPSVPTLERKLPSKAVSNGSLSKPLASRQPTLSAVSADSCSQPTTPVRFRPIKCSAQIADHAGESASILLRPRTAESETVKLQPEMSHATASSLGLSGSPPSTPTRLTDASQCDVTPIHHNITLRTPTSTSGSGTSGLDGNMVSPLAFAGGSPANRLVGGSNRSTGAAVRAVQ